MVNSDGKQSTPLFGRHCWMKLRFN